MIMNYISILKSNTKIWKWYQNDTYAPVQKPNWRPTTPNWRPTTSNYIQPPTVGGTQMAQGDDAVY